MLWHDRAVFHFLTDEADRRAYRNALAAGLSTDGHVIIATFGPNGPETCSGLPVARYGESDIAEIFGGLSHAGRINIRRSHDTLGRTPSVYVLPLRS